MNDGFVFCGDGSCGIHFFVSLQEYVLQPDGSVTPLNNVQNYVLSEQQAGEILAQVIFSA